MGPRPKRIAISRSVGVNKQKVESMVAPPGKHLAADGRLEEIMLWWAWHLTFPSVRRGALVVLDFFAYGDAQLDGASLLLKELALLVDAPEAVLAMAAHAKMRSDGKHVPLLASAAEGVACGADKKKGVGQHRWAAEPCVLGVELVQSRIDHGSASCAELILKGRAQSRRH